MIFKHLMAYEVLFRLSAKFNELKHRLAVQLEDESNKKMSVEDLYCLATAMQRSALRYIATRCLSLCLELKTLLGSFA
jgi:hypothetical protein